MKGTIKAFKRTPQMLGAKLHLSNKSTDPEFDEFAARFSTLEEHVSKLLKDVDSFYKNIELTVTSPAAFASSLECVLRPLPTDDPSKYPEAQRIREYLPSYIEESGEIERTIRPELELIVARVITPLKEYQDVMKHIRKAITKRDHKLVDFDRHTNAYNKLQAKQNRSAKEEKHVYELEAEVEAATIQYDNINTKLKQELPVFFDLTQSFITPLFETFYFAQAGILYTMLEHYHSWATERFDDVSIETLESHYKEQLGTVGQRFENLNITRKFISTQHLLSVYRNGGMRGTSPIGSGADSVHTTEEFPESSFKSKTEYASENRGSAAGPAEAASVVSPPSYGDSKRDPKYVVALYDFTAQADGDLTFKAGDKIELIHRTDTVDDWWTGRVHGREGIFPGNYVQ